MKRLVVPSLILLSLTGCSAINPPVNRSASTAIGDELRKAAKAPAQAPKPAETASPESVNNLLIPPVSAFAPPPSSAEAQQRFDLSVSDAPIGQVLSGLVAGTDYSMLLKPSSPAPMPPATEGAPAVVQEMEDPANRRISLKLKNVTLFEALEAIRDLYGYDFTVTGRRILVQPEQLQTRLYQVNYVLGQRRGVSDIQVIGGASGGGSGGSSSTNSSDSRYSSIQASGMTTKVSSDIWTEAEDALRTLLGCKLSKASRTGVGGGTSTGSTSGAATSTSGTSSSGTNSNASAKRSDTSFPGELTESERSRGADGCSSGRAITVNQMSGLVVARAMPNELRMVEKVLRSMQMNISRQVIIEAKILDVELNSDSQQGINWSVFRDGLQRFSVGGAPGVVGVNQPSLSTSAGGTIASGTSLSALLGTSLVGTSAGTAFSSGLGITIQARNFAALLNFLESQGRVHVLSSPRIATLNNQKAVIKVGSEEPFVTNIAGGSVTTTSSGNTQTQPPTLQYQPFFAGIALDVTPQIDAEDNITLHVHSMVNNVAERLKIALPESDVRVPFAANTINETDSVVQAKDGQVIVIGGLMNESTSDNRGGVPGLRGTPGLGALFSKGAQSSVKRELVILLKPTIVKDPSAWVTDLTATGDRISAMDRPR